MKKIYLLALLALSPAVTLLAQEALEKNLKSFDKIIASPHIHVVLKKGDKEGVRLTFNDPSVKDKMNVEVSGKTLHLYLDGARKIEKYMSSEDRSAWKRGVYHGISITAYVTYTKLTSVEMRGEQQLTCNEPIEADEFTLRAYGENQIKLASLKAEYLLIALYGENKVEIRDGKVLEQRYKLFGQNDINTREMKSAYASTSIFGEGRVQLYSAREVRISAFGEPRIEVEGGGHVSKQLVLGEAHIRKY
jgi:hypothetical protein